MCTRTNLRHEHYRAPFCCISFHTTEYYVRHEPGIPKEMPHPEGIVLGCKEAVTATLGEPESIIELGTQKTIQYRLGEVVFEKDRLIRAKFISEENGLGHRPINRFSIKRQSRVRSCTKT